MLSSFSFTKVPHGFHNSISACIEPLNPALECSLHVVFNLSSSIFIDAYELSQQDGYRVRLSEPMNLELPSRALRNETTSVLLDIDIHRSADQASLCVDVPLHYRYADLVDTGHSAYHLVNMDDPVAFWACPELGALPSSGNLGPFQSSFRQRQITFIPSTSTMPWRELPVGKQSHIFYVENITALSAFLALLYLSHIGWRAVTAMSRKKTE